MAVQADELERASKVLRGKNAIVVRSVNVVVVSGSCPAHLAVELAQGQPESQPGQVARVAVQSSEIVHSDTASCVLHSIGADITVVLLYLRCSTCPGGICVILFVATDRREGVARHFRQDVRRDTPTCIPYTQRDHSAVPNTLARRFGNRHCHRREVRVR